ncbi:MAG: SufD family Fe-S cluster assembly protein [Firmicutes bacterium]|nr:SufD family Fe-S cluster assembly protein [Bacillota bacterium]
MIRLSLNNNDFIDNLSIIEDTVLDVRLDNCSNDICINVMDNMCLEVFEIGNNTSNKVTYNLGSNAQVIVYKISRNNSDIIRVNLNGEKSSIKFYSSLMNYSNNTYDFKVRHNASYSESDIVNHCVNFTESEFRFLVDSDIKKESLECICNQDNKIIDMIGGKNYISPNLLVDNDLITANHSAYIGKFKKDIMFYLKSRGIRERECNLLLIRGFLLEKMNLDELMMEEYVSFINSNLG